MSLCECGCGLPAPLAKRTDKRWGWTKNRPKRFIQGHNPYVRGGVASRPPSERFWPKVHKTDLCWFWIGSTAATGYPFFEGTTATRFAYEELVGPIPTGYHLDHLCRNTRCVNPAHLEPVTQAENSRRQADANRKPTCPHGHLRYPGSEYIYGKKRYCRECYKERARKAREKAAA